MATNIGFGHVYTSRVQDSVNSGKGVFDPGRIAWEEDENGKVFIDGVRCRVIGNGHTELVPPGPSPLAPKTIRFDFHYDHFDPTTLVDYGGLGATWTHVEDDVYNFYFNSTYWGLIVFQHLQRKLGLFHTYSSTLADMPFAKHKYDVIDANLEGVTSVEQLFGGTAMRGLQSVASIRNTSSVTNFKNFLSMGVATAAYTSIPLFDTSSAEDVRDMCKNASKVTTGALALYTQMSTQANPPTRYSGCFTGCGANAAQDAPIHAEMAQIPASWGGTMS